MNEQTQTNLMHLIRLRERQRFSDEAPKPLPQRVIPTLDMGRLPAVFATSRVLVFRDDILKRLHLWE